MSDDVKMQIRRRLYVERRRARVDFGELANFFDECVVCRGEGMVCREFLTDGVPTATLDACDFCDGDGFVPLQKMTRTNTSVTGGR